MRPADVSIRTGQPEDAAAVHDLHTNSVRNLCAETYSAEAIDGWLSGRSPGGYLDPIKRGDLFVAEQLGRIVGFGQAVPGTVVAIYVHPSFAQQGIGTALLKHALQIAASEPGRPVRLEATLNALAFYQSAGFRQVARSTVERNNVHIPVVIMERDAS